MAIKTVLVDDHRLFRRGLCLLLKKNEGIEVIGEAGDGREAIALAKRLLPALIIMDPSMPGLNGMDATAAIKHEFPDTKVIGLSMHSDRRFISSMLSAGASGYLLKTCDEEELCHAISLVMSGKTYLSPEVTGTIVEELINPSQKAEAQGNTLSGREREILQMLSEGKSAKEIGIDLGVSARTIDSHRQHIMSKLGLYTLPELTKYAVKAGITSL